MKRKQITLVHPDLDGSGTCLEPALDIWLAKGFQVLEDTTPAPETAPEPEWTAPESSKEKAATVADETKES